MLITFQCFIVHDITMIRLRIHVSYIIVYGSVIFFSKTVEYNLTVILRWGGLPVRDVDLPL